MVNWSKSSSTSTQWEGVDGYVPEWIKRSELYGKMNTREKQQIALMSDKELADKYGFIHGDAVDKRYQDAVTAKYDQLDNQTRLARDTSLTDTAGAVDSYLLAMRDQNAKRAQTGVQKGSSAAQEMAMSLASQKSIQEAQQQYHDTMAKLADERGTAAYASRIDALKERNAVANQMGTLGMQKYGFDVQDEAAYLSYLGEVGKYQAEYNKAAGAWNASEGQNTRRKTGESSSWSESYDNSAEIAAAAQREAAQINAGSQERIAKMNYDAYMKGLGTGNGTGIKYPAGDADYEKRYGSKKDLKPDAVAGASPSLSSMRNRGQIDASNKAYWDYQNIKY